MVRTSSPHHSLYVLYDPIFNSIWRLARWKCLETGEMTNPLEYGKCLETGETKKSLERSLFQGIWSFLLFLDTLRIQYCLETLFSRDLVVLPVSRHFFVRKVSRNSQTTKSLEIMTFQGILLFLLFLDTFHIQGDLSFPLFPDTSTELSAAGANLNI